MPDRRQALTDQPWREFERILTRPCDRRPLPLGLDPLADRAFETDLELLDPDSVAPPLFTRSFHLGREHREQSTERSEL